MGDRIDSAKQVLDEAFFGWVHVACLPLLFLGPFHPFAPGHLLNPIPSL